MDFPILIRLTTNRKVSGLQWMHPSILCSLIACAARTLSRGSGVCLRRCEISRIMRLRCCAIAEPCFQTWEQERVNTWIAVVTRSIFFCPPHFSLYLSLLLPAGLLLCPVHDDDSAAVNRPLHKRRNSNTRACGAVPAWDKIGRAN